MAANTGGGGGSSAAIRAGQAFVELFTKDDGLRAGLDRAKSMMSSAGSFMAKAGLGMVAAGTAGLGILGGVVAKAVGDNTAVLDLADKFGLTTEKLSSFTYAVKGAGLGLDDVDKLFEKFNEKLTEASNGGEEASTALAKLGLTAQDLKGMDQVDRMVLAMERLKGLAKEDRLGVENALGGGKFQDLNRAVTRMGPDGIRGKMGEADKAGAQVDGQTAERAKAIQEAWNAALDAISNTLGSIGEALFPNITSMDLFKSKILDTGESIRNWIKQNASIISVSVGVAAALIAVGMPSSSSAPA